MFGGCSDPSKALRISTAVYAAKGRVGLAVFWELFHQQQFRSDVLSVSYPKGAPVFVEGGACTTAQWHNGQYNTGKKSFNPQ